MSNVAFKSRADLDDDSENETAGKTVQTIDDMVRECSGIRGAKEKFKPDSRENSSSRKRVKYHSNSDSDSVKSSRPRKPLELETDASILQRRQKQIDYGKNTVGYHNYIQQVRTDKRTKDHPKTPDKYAKYSRRSWDTLIKMWRKKLHEYDTDKKDGDPAGAEEESDSDGSSTK